MAAVIATAALPAPAEAGAERRGPRARKRPELTGFAGAFHTWNTFYKRALYATGMGTVEGATKPLASSREAWYALLAEHAKKPPSEFAGDPQWSQDLVTITGYLHLAEWRAHGRDLEGAHEALERVRYLWREVRERNGVRWFGDELLRFHDVMEPLVEWGTGAARGGVTPENVEEFAQEVQRMMGAFVSLRNFHQKPPWPPRRFQVAMTRQAQAIQALANTVAARDYEAIPPVAGEVKKAFLPLYMGFG